jgi:hypothetical protein
LTCKSCWTRRCRWTSPYKQKTTAHTRCDHEACA